jgi:hypothetical protein
MVQRHNPQVSLLPNPPTRQANRALNRQIPPVSLLPLLRTRHLNRVVYPLANPFPSLVDSLPDNPLPSQPDNHRFNRLIQVVDRLHSLLLILPRNQLPARQIQPLSLRFNRPNNLLAAPLPSLLDNLHSSQPVNRQEFLLRNLLHFLHLNRLPNQPEGPPPSLPHSLRDSPRNNQSLSQLLFRVVNLLVNHRILLPGCPLHNRRSNRYVSPQDSPLVILRSNRLRDRVNSLRVVQLLNQPDSRPVNLLTVRQ